MRDTDKQSVQIQMTQHTYTTKGEYFILCKLLTHSLFSIDNVHVSFSHPKIIVPSETYGSFSSHSTNEHKVETTVASLHRDVEHCLFLKFKLSTTDEDDNFDTAHTHSLTACVHGPGINDDVCSLQFKVQCHETSEIPKDKYTQALYISLLHDLCTPTMFWTPLAQNKDIISNCISLLQDFLPHSKSCITLIQTSITPLLHSDEIYQQTGHAKIAQLFRDGYRQFQAHGPTQQ